MRIGSTRRKPMVGPELAVTFSLPEGTTAEQSAEAVCGFLDGVRELSSRLGVAWISMRLSGLPEELEPRLIEAKETYELEHGGGPRLVVDNTPRGRLNL